MTALGNLKTSRIRSNFLFCLGANLGANGLLVLAIYYLVAQISSQDARELLGWLVPAAQGCCVVAAMLLTAGLSTREAPSPGAGKDSSRGWMIGKIMPWAGGPRSAGSVAERKSSAAEAEAILSLLKKLDWNVFRDLSIAYFRVLGFRVVDQLDRSKGVDFLLYLKGDYRPIGVRCLPWGTKEVDLKQVRNIHRSMLLAGVSEGVLLTTGVFDEEAFEFGEANGLELLSGKAFVIRLMSMPADTSEKLLRDAAAAGSIRFGGGRTA